MKKNILSKVLSLIIVAGMLLGAIPINATAKPMPQTEVFIEQSVLDEMETNGKASYMVQFKNDVDLSPAFSMDWNARGWFVYDTLYAQMRQSQAALQNYLIRSDVEFEPFWINNSIFVRDSTPSVLNAVQDFAGVLSIESEKTMFIYEPERAQKPDQETMGVEPHLAHIHAPEVWEMGITGEGYTVMNIDTGARYTHEALVNQYRGNLGDGEFDHNYNWFTPVEHTDIPRDGNNHGTHTMGTMVGADASGSNQIGVAPGASWGACEGCPGGICPDSLLLGCAQFVVAPTKLDGSDPDPDKRPIVVNNSWGSCQQVYDPWYRAAVDAWVAAGVYPVFSNGNNTNCGYPSNPPLNTVGNPGRYGNVSGVGSTGRDDGVYAPHSNKGPTDNLDEINPVDGWADLKPQFVSPGINIRSSIATGNSDYDEFSGTSMSAPSVAGLVALITQAAPCLQGQYATIETIIEQTATPIPYGYPPGSPETYPNYATGWGEINALAAVQLALSMCGDITLTGTVSSDSDELLSDVKITITPEDGSAQVAFTHTNEAGIYSAKVNPGDYSITASKVGYVSQTAAVSIAADSPDPFVLDFVLTSRAPKLVTGTVSEGGVSDTDLYGYPLFAKLVFEASDHSLETYSDPFSGAYSISLYNGVDYQVTVSTEIAGYTESHRLLEGDFEPSQNFALMVDKSTCSAPGYPADVNLYYDFNDTFVFPQGWEVHDYFEIGAVWQVYYPTPWGEWTRNLTDGNGHFAAIDSRANPGTQYIYTGLYSEVLDLSTSTEVYLDFESYLGQIGQVGYLEAGINVSTNGGNTWNNFYVMPTETNKAHYHLDISSELAGQTQARIEFYFLLFDGQALWQIDNIKLISNCQRQRAGVAAGYVFDANLEDTKLINVHVKTDNHEAKTIAHRFSDAANGLYWLHVPVNADTQDFEFEIYKDRYQTLLATRDIQENQINRHDFQLNSGLLVSEPDIFELTMGLFDSPQNRTLNFENQGSVSANLQLTTGNRGFAPLKLNIPAFTGELPPQSEPVSIGKAPHPDAQNSSHFEYAFMNNELARGLANVPAAVGIDAQSNELWRWQDLSQTQDYETRGTPEPTNLFAGDFLGADYDTLYAISNADNKLYAIDTNTATSTFIAQTAPPVGSFTGLTGAQGFFYAVASNCDNSVLTRINPDGTVIEIGTIPNSPCMIDIAYVPYEDMLYGVDLATDSLHRIDPRTGYDTIVGSLGFDANYAQGMDYDEANGILYWVAQSGSVSELRVIDLQSGASMPVSSFPAGSQVDAYAIESVDNAGAVPWLSLNPIQANIPPGGSFNTELTFSVNSIIEQPGDYHALIGGFTDTPYMPPQIPVTLHVLRPENWGNFKGTVSISEQCDLNPVPISGAEILIYQDDVLLKRLLSDENGGFSYAFEEGNFKIVFSYPGHVSQVIEDIRLNGGEDLILDINLRHDSACLSYQPETFFSEQYRDHLKTHELNFVNTGARESVIEIREMPGDSLIPQTLSLDTGKLGSTYFYGGQFIWLNRFTPEEGAFPFTLSAVEVYWYSISMADPEHEYEIVIYQNKQSQHDPAPGAELLYRQKIDSIEHGRFQTYDLDEPVYLEGPGDVLIGFMVTRMTYKTYPAAASYERPLRRSWVGAGNPEFFEDPSSLSSLGLWVVLDNSQYSNVPLANWMIRGYGYRGEPRDIPWLELDSYAGVVPPDGGSLDITLNFNSNDLEPGEYFGDLMISHLPDPWIKLSVKMQVLPQEQLYFPLIRQHLQ